MINFNRSEKPKIPDGVRQVKMRYKMDDHDFRVRVDQTRRFLKSGDTVDILVIFRSTEVRKFSQGREQLYRLEWELRKDVSTSFFVESPPTRDGRIIKMTLKPLEKRSIS